MELVQFGLHIIRNSEINYSIMMMEVKQTCHCDLTQNQYKRPEKSVFLGKKSV